LKVGDHGSRVVDSGVRDVINVAAPEQDTDDETGATGAR
jgi:hypothetical protein